MKLSLEIREHRRKGISTAIAFETIAEAIRNPGTWIEVKDHHPHRKSDGLVYRNIMRIVKDQNLDFKFNNLDFTIMSMHYGIHVLEDGTMISAKRL